MKEVKEIKAWKTDDDRVFETEEEAKLHQAVIQWQPFLQTLLDEILRKAKQTDDPVNRLLQVLYVRRETLNNIWEYIDPSVEDEGE